MARGAAGWAAYIEVQPCAGLARFNLKGLTPEMFTQNISDMVNVRGWFFGAVENEQQIAVAHWEMNEEAYLQAMCGLTAKLTHLQIVNRLETLPGCIQELDSQFVDFEEKIVSRSEGGHAAFSGYRLTVVTEDIGEKIAPYAFYNLDTCTAEGWQGVLPPPEDHETVRNAMTKKLQAIIESGVQIAQVYDETDYAVTQLANEMDVKLR